MSVSHRYLTYRGDVIALAGRDTQLAFLTALPDAPERPLHVLDTDSGAYTAVPLPAPGTALAHADDKLFIAVTGGAVLSTTLGKDKVAKPKKLLVLPDAPEGPSLLTALDVDTLAAAHGTTLWLAESKKVTATFETDAAITALGGAADGNWLVVGCADGTATVFSREADADGSTAWRRVESVKVHDGNVNAALFSDAELRVLTAGADGALMAMHVRGALVPEARSGKTTHDGHARVLHAGADGAAYCAGQDGVLRVWPKKGRAAKFSGKLGDVRHLATVTRRGHAHLVAAAHGKSGLRFVQLDAKGKPAEEMWRVHGALDWARRELQDADKKRRQDALDELLGWPEAGSLALLTEAATSDADAALRVRAAENLGRIGTLSTVRFLRELMKDGPEGVRVAALNGLLGFADLAHESLQAALGTRHSELACAALEHLAARAKTDAAAAQALDASIAHQSKDVRFLALDLLQKAGGKGDVRFALHALTRGKADIQREALHRAVAADLLGDPGLRRAIRVATTSRDESVHLAAFYTAVKSQPRLAAFLRYHDADVHRALSDLEGSVGKDGKLKAAKKPKKTEALTADDVVPLLEAVGSTRLAVRMRGTLGLATVQDPRAFGALLQQSAHKDAAVRAEAARALARLDDDRAQKRLAAMVHDAETLARDAAYTGLLNHAGTKALDAASAGLSSRHADVRARGLQTLVELVRPATRSANKESAAKKAPKALSTKDGKTALALLGRTLQDADSRVRGEATKAALNTSLLGDTEAVLALLAGNMHADVRQTALREAMAHLKNPWGYDVVAGFTADSAPSLRREAFTFLWDKARSKRKDLAAHGAQSPHADMRIRAAKAVLELPVGTASEAPLHALLADADDAVRTAALDVLRTRPSDAAVDAALAAPFADAQITGARLLAARGDTRATAAIAAALDAPEPEDSAAREAWAARLLTAFDAAADLGDTALAAALARHAQSPDLTFARAATHALAWSADEAHHDALAAALAHKDKQVQRSAALGLAALGDLQGAATLDQTGTDAEKLALALVRGTDALSALLHSKRRPVANAAFLALLLAEWARPGAGPDGTLIALAAPKRSMRLTAARAVANFNTPAAFEAVVVDTVHDSIGAIEPSAVDLATLHPFGVAIAAGSPLARLAMAPVLFAVQGDAKNFPGVQRRFMARHGAALAALKAPARPKPAYDTDALVDLAMGAFVGQLGDGQARPALFAMLDLAQTHGRDLSALTPVLTQALHHTDTEVRVRALDTLKAIGLPTAQLVGDALASANSDVVGRAMDILAETPDAGVADDLARFVAEGTDGSEHEALRVLGTMKGTVFAHTVGLGAASARLRAVSVAALAASDEPGAREALHGGLSALHQDTVEACLEALAVKHDDIVLSHAHALVASDRHDAQSRGAALLVSHGTADAAHTLVGRLKTAPHTANASALLRHVASLKDITVVDDLAALAAHDKVRSDALQTLFKLSGFSQWLDWEEDTDTLDMDTWRSQNKRHTAVFARYLETALTHGDWRALRRPDSDYLKWAPEGTLDGVLADMAKAPDDRTRKLAVRSIAYRCRWRNADAAPLVPILGDKDPDIAFEAAVGLAYAGDAQGMSMLLSAVELSTSLSDRERAVLALGALANERALDLLLRLMEDDTHALQRAATTAVGHMGHTSKAEHIRDTLLTRAKSDATSMATAAIRGLAALGGDLAWSMVRTQLGHRGWSVREEAARQLAKDISDATRDALIARIPEEDDCDVAEAAAQALLKQFPDGAVEPLLTIVRGDDCTSRDEAVRTLASGEHTAAILGLLPVLLREDIDEDDVKKPLLDAVLRATPAPAAEAAALLDSADMRVVGFCAQILAQASTLKAKAKKQLEAALGTAQAACTEASTRWARQERRAADTHAAQALGALVTAAGKHGVGQDHIAAAITTTARELKDVRKRALLAAAEGKLTAAMETALLDASAGADPEARSIAVSALASDVRRVPALAENLLNHPPSASRVFGRAAPALTAKADKAVLSTLRAASQDTARQGLGLPLLIQRGDVEGLLAIATNTALDEAVRLGGIEGLGRSGATAAADHLATLGKDENNSEDLRKAAWRARRRLLRTSRTASKEASA